MRLKRFFSCRDLWAKTLVMAGIFYLPVLLVFFSGEANAQSYINYHLTQDNGLPSNTVYGMITDRLGYLWICTDKGVAKFNGYSFKYFDESDGLVSDDVWEMVEDHQGRIWLASFGSKMGYIANDRYHRVYLASPRKAVFPIDIRASRNGIVFKSEPYRVDASGHELCYSRGDSIYSKPLEWIPEGNEGLVRFTSHGAWREDGLQYSAMIGRHIYSFDFTDTNRLFEKKMTPQYCVKIHDTDIGYYTDTRNFRFGDNLLSFASNERASITNLLTGKITQTRFDLLGDTVIRYLHFEKDKITNNKINVVTDHHILTCSVQNDSIMRIASDKIVDLVGGDFEPQKITTFHKKGNWFLLGSLTQGARLVRRSALPVVGMERTIPTGRLIGRLGDSMTFWFDRVDNIFTACTRDGVVARHSNPYLTSATKVEHYAADTLLIYARYPFYYVPSRNEFTLVSKLTPGLYGGVKVGARINVISQYGYFHVDDFSDIAKSRLADPNRFNGIVYLKKLQSIVCYNKERVIVDGSDGRIDVIKNGDNIWGTTVGDVHHIAVDSSRGSAYVVGRDKVFLLDIAQKRCKPLLSDILLKDVVALIVDDNKLCVVWRYGVLFAKILASGNLGTVVKETDLVRFRQVSDAYIVGNQLKLVTKEHTLSISVPDFSDTATSASSLHRFVVKLDNYAKVLQTKDTIFLEQHEAKFLIDIINPYGVGKPKFFVAFGENGVEQLLNSNEVNIPGDLKKGRYVRFAVRASDASWVSEPVYATIYIRPKWYQTPTGEIVLILLIVIVGIAVVGLTVAVTRRMVLKRNERKQTLTELELKSIYAQINPHFIFNTLNSALLLISKNRMDEAYQHVSKFSRLLRSYLRSSRNKFVSVTEEAANLRNYIELQQARFKSRFSFEIFLDPNIEQKDPGIPSLLIQPFVENSINHGLLPSKSEGKLTVSFILVVEENKVICTIEDNGIGREQSRLDKIGREDVRESYGDLIIKDLVSAFNKYEKMNVHVSYYDKPLPETGTVVTIVIKNPHYES